MFYRREAFCYNKERLFTGGSEYEMAPGKDEILIFKNFIRNAFRIAYSIDHCGGYSVCLVSLTDGKGVL